MMVTEHYYILCCLEVSAVGKCVTGCKNTRGHNLEDFKWNCKVFEPSNAPVDLSDQPGGCVHLSDRALFLFQEFVLPLVTLVQIVADNGLCYGLLFPNHENFNLFFNLHAPVRDYFIGSNLHKPILDGFVAVGNPQQPSASFMH